MISLRKIIVNGLTILTYVGSIYWLFVVTNFPLSALAVAAFYVIAHFAMIELKHKARLWHFFLLLLAAATLLSIFLADYSWYFIISLYLFHAGIFFLFYFILDALQNREYLSSREIIHVGGYIFTVFLTLSYVTLILALYETFPFTCEALYTNSDSVIDRISAPFALGDETVLSIKENLNSTSGLSVKDALGLTGDLVVGTIHSGEYAGVYSGTLVHSGGLLGVFETYKARLVDQVIADNSAVNMNICELLISNIEQKYNEPVFQFSVILLMFLLLYPFLRVVVYVIEGLAWLVFKLFLVLGIYSIEKTIKEVEDIF